MPPPGLSSIVDFARETVLRERALARAKEFDPAAAEVVNERVRAADRRLTAAAELAVEPTLAAAASLARDALVLALDAWALARSGTPSASPVATLDAAREALAHAGVDVGAIAAARDALEAGDPLHFDRGSTEETERARVALVAVADGVVAAARVPTVPEVKRGRAMRLALVALALVALAGQAGRLAISPRNVARGKPASASSRHPAALSGPEGLTDGSTSAAYGAHTDREVAPWVQVDLQKPFAIDRVKIYNRADGWFDDSLPLVLELSDDGVSFAELARRAEHFGADSPWVAELGARRGRFVRVRHPGSGLVVLGEIEVYGKAIP